MTQHQLILEWLKENRSIKPAYMGGKEYKGHIFGSETTARCRELRKKGILEDFDDGRFVCFKLKGTGSPLAGDNAESDISRQVTENKSVQSQNRLFMPGPIIN